MGWRQELGIYPDDIDAVFDICQDAIEEVQELAESLGYTEDVTRLADCNIEDETIATLGDNIDVHDIANSLISRSLALTSEVLEATSTCRDLGVTFIAYENGRCSSLCAQADLPLLGTPMPDPPMTIKGLNSTVYEGSSDISDVISASFVEHLCDIVLEDNGSRLNHVAFESVDETADVLKQRIANDQSLFDAQDIYACLHNHEVTGTIKKMANDFLKEQKEKNAKATKDKDER